MSKSGPVDHDDDGNPVPLPADGSDLAQLIQLLEYARVRGFRVGPLIQIGGIAVQVRDLRQHEGRRDTDDAPDPGPWARAGHTED